MIWKLRWCLLFPGPRTPKRRVGAGAFPNCSSSAGAVCAGGSPHVSGPLWRRTMGIDMFAGLVWRTILFFGLTAGYTILAALPYLS